MQMILITACLLVAILMVQSNTETLKTEINDLRDRIIVLEE